MGGLHLDLADPASIRAAVNAARPDWIVHGAAMTNVDGCEKEPTTAHLVNGVATGQLAAAAAEIEARMVYVSTDYVFDGERGRYREEDPTNPISAYGASKLAGEHAARAALPDVAIARTSVVYGPHKNNFVLWLVGELKAGRRVRIVEDQVVTPTLTYDLAHQILALIDARADGIYHTAGATRLSRLEMAHAIAEAWQLDVGLIDPVKSSDLTWIAKRPRDSSLDTTKMSRLKLPMTLAASLSKLKTERERLHPSPPGAPA